MKATKSTTAKTTKVTKSVKTTEKGIVSIPLSEIIPSSFNPRRSISEEDLQELANSISQQGVIQPIVVRNTGEKYEIVCGERRYRASVLAGLEAIPAVVRELADDEAIEFAITENLQRKDISPIEEATAYKKLIDTKRYDIASLAIRFGKCEAYIRNRLKLNDLIDNVLNLVNDDIIPISIALELCKYTPAMQEDIYEKHLQGNTGYYSDWRNLKTKEFVNRLEKHYCSDLNKYFFDKTVCANCPFNTNCYNLFTDNNSVGKCTNLVCLTDKNNQYLVEACKEMIEKHPELDICQSPHSQTNENIYGELSEQGYAICEVHAESFPEQPEQPKREHAESEEEFEELKNDYYEALAEYTEEMEEIEQLMSEGKIKRLVKVEDNRPKICFVRLQDDIDNNGIGKEIEKEDTDPIGKLQKQDKRNKEIAVEKIVDDTKKYIRDVEIPQSDFTDFEERLLYFIMLSDLKREHFGNFIENPKNKWYLDDEDKFSLFSNLTEEQKTVIRRDFIVKHISDTYGVSKKSLLMLEFVKLHFPDELSAIETQYNDVYNKRHARIEEKLTALTKDCEAA